MKFSIITPAYNMAPWIARTIETVLNQAGDFEIEYIVMEDGSKDRTVAIAQEYEKRVESGIYPVSCNKISMQVVSQEQNIGMYEAINRGFARATGDIYAWINADDTYEPGAFEAVAKVFNAYPEVEWLKGVGNVVDTEWKFVSGGQCRIYRQDWLAAGVYGQESYFVDQDTVFWRAELWEKVQPMPAHYRSAADYWLWVQMAKHARLWTLNKHVSNFMRREGQISKGVSKYKKEQWDARPHRSLKAWGAKLFFTPQSRLSPHLESFFLWLYPKLYMRRPEEYLVIENGYPIKKLAHSFLISSNI
jgi:glycosyltransferase involved in cell wall biosynthesis